jgi:hypothetical protein
MAKLIEGKRSLLNSSSYNPVISGVIKKNCGQGENNPLKKSPSIPQVKSWVNRQFSESHQVCENEEKKIQHKILKEISTTTHPK